MEITERISETVRAALRQMESFLRQGLLQPILQELTPDFYSSYQVSGFMGDVLELHNGLVLHKQLSSPMRFEVPDHLLPVMKALLMRARRELATEIDGRKARTTNPAVIAALEKELEPLDRLVREDWFVGIAAAPLPHLRDVLNMERVEDITQSRV